MAPLRFVMVGCGAIATSCHLPALSRYEDAELVAVVDHDLPSARKVARQFGAKLALGDCRGLRGLVDAAIVATPNSTHVVVARELLECGVHVLCENPLATTPADARSLFETSRRIGARIMPAHVRRFQANLVTAQQLVGRGIVGQPTSLVVSQSSPKGQWASRTAYREDRHLAGGGVLIELGVHLIDLALWFLGRQLTGALGSLTWGGVRDLESDAEITLQFERGVRAEIAVSDRRPLERTLLVRGTDGWVATSLDEDRSVSFFSRAARACRFDGAQKARVDVEDIFHRQLVEFCHSIRAGLCFPVPEEDVLLGLDLIANLYAAPTIGREAAE